MWTSNQHKRCIIICTWIKCCSQVTISIQILVLNPLLYSKWSKNINRLKKCEQEYYHMYMNQICSKVTIESPLLLLGKSPNPDGSIITPWSQHMNISWVPTHTVHSSWMSTQHTTRSQPFCYVPYICIPKQRHTITNVLLRVKEDLIFLRVKKDLLCFLRVKKDPNMPENPHSH